eukprot:3088118-Pleurochrysis_carterae.AAC.1
MRAQVHRLSLARAGRLLRAAPFSRRQPRARPEHGEPRPDRQRSSTAARRLCACVAGRAGDGVRAARV